MMDMLLRRIAGFAESLYYNPHRVARKRDNIHAEAGVILLKSTRFIINKTNSVRIGKDSMVGCRFVFESGKGEISIGKRCYISGGTQLISRDRIKIGNDVTIAWDCTIYDHNSHSLDWEHRAQDQAQQASDFSACGDFIRNKNWDTVKSRPITIGDKVWIGFASSILSGVTVGEGAIIGACSVVRDDVEPWTAVIGNPARSIKRLK